MANKFFATGTARRDFTATASRGAISLAAPSFMSRAKNAALPWYRRAYRWGQTSRTEKDPALFGIACLRWHWKRTEVHRPHAGGSRPARREEASARSRPSSCELRKMGLARRRLDNRGRPGLVGCHVYRQQDRVIVHLVNLTTAATRRPPAEDLIPVEPFKTRLNGLTGRPNARLLLARVYRPIAPGSSAVAAVFEVESSFDHEVVIIG